MVRSPAAARFTGPQILCCELWADYISLKRFPSWWSIFIPSFVSIFLINIFLKSISIFWIFSILFFTSNSLISFLKTDKLFYFQKNKEKVAGLLKKKQWYKYPNNEQIKKRIETGCLWRIDRLQIIGGWGGGETLIILSFPSRGPEIQKLLN